MSVFNNAKNLGFGLMRMPLTNPDDAKSVDVDAVKKMVDIFLQNGFTYFDTAIMYHETVSQHIVKQVLTDRYPRDTFTVATKLHWNYFNSKEDIENIFTDQQNATGLDYFDYYLIHAINRENYKKYQQFECFEWLKNKKAEGKVRHIGISYHDKADFLDVILSEHPEIEFVQLQINYLDWESDTVDAANNYKIAEKYGKEVVVMEPVKGGMLANPPEVVKNMLLNRNPEMSVASWAIRFAASQKNVKMVLSGMSSIGQMEDNISFMKDFKPLNPEELLCVKNAAAAINETLKVPCTACEYCTAGCPKNIPIPKYFSLYNADAEKAYFINQSKGLSAPQDCIKCKKCEKVCPQHIKITSELENVVKYYG